MNIDYDTIVPSVVKKGATGKGNADKDMMYESFSKETNTDLKKMFDVQKIGNPVSDICLNLCIGVLYSRCSKPKIFFDIGPIYFFLLVK